MEEIKCLTGETAWDTGLRKVLADSLNRPISIFPKIWNGSKGLTLSYPALDSNPNMSNCLELRKGPKGGPNAFNFFATKRLKPGDVVLIEDACFWKISRQGLFELCDYCGADAALALMPCMECGLVFYCSNACHKAGVSEYHWFECKVLRNHPLLTSTTSLLMLRIFATGYTAYKKDFVALYQHFLQMTKKNINPLRVYNATDRSAKARYDSLFAVPLSTALKKLYDNDKQIAEDVDQLFDCLMETVQSTSRTGKSRCSRAELSKLLKHYAIILTRNMTITHIKLEVPLGLNAASGEGSDVLQGDRCGTHGFYPLLSLFSVSCNPNITLISTASNRLVLVATRPVAQDERLTILGYYTFHTTNREQRQAAMQEHLKMVCECDACVYDYAMINPLPELTACNEDDLKKLAGELRSIGVTDPPYSCEFLWIQTLFQQMLTYRSSMRLSGMIGYVDTACWKDIDLLAELYDTESRQEN
uniref:MYND-type domain-containing protein n=2 Tax=Anopheles albimanus TaxID=7167 RepID=A0A182FVA6_ANOAL